MAEEPDDLAAEAALENERRFVVTLGGIALEIAGATLVTHEKLPAPRFNFVQELGVGPERQTAFFERALDHYFQRALRPTFRVPRPVPDHLDAGLRRFGFRPRSNPLVLLLSTGSAPRRTGGPVEVRVASPRELDLVAGFWAAERERAEFRAALDIVLHHPNPHERLVPLLADIEGRPGACALVYRYRSSAGIYGVATQPESRGRGGASDLVAYARVAEPVGSGVRLSIWADSERLERRLESLGFRRGRAFVEYELPPGTELAFPPPGPPSGPRWRPPRSA